MADKFSIFSPNNNRFTAQSAINFKKSPNKFAIYESMNRPKEPQYKSTNSQVSSHNEFETVRKLPSEQSNLRQTMSYKPSQLNAWKYSEPDKDKGKEINPMRQTMGQRSALRYKTEKSLSDSFSEQVYIRNNQSSSYLGQSRKIGGIAESRSSANLYEPKTHYEYRKIADKLNQNSKMIEELRKLTVNNKQEEDFQRPKLGNQRKYSYQSYDHEQEREIDQKLFKKKKKEQSFAQFYTPKLQKSSYEQRFQGSVSPTTTNNSDNKKTLSNITSVSDLKKKTSAVSLPSSLNVKIGVNDFVMGKNLGQGKFGSVNIVKHRRTECVFALKKIPKALIKSHMMVEQLALELRLQSCLNHKNILSMYGFFDDSTHLYIVLEYMEQGTLYSKLKKSTTLKQPEAAAVIRQITEAIEYLHDLGIAHRDIKPQNIVMSNNISKLCDFGWATFCDERRKTYCGTFDYAAPEILQGVEYDMTVDLWCLGILTFELLTGKAPFYHISRKETMKRIMNVQNQTITYPEHVSKEAADFIDKLIRKNPCERIKAAEALNHPFLKHADSD